jgi:hypothetical protein
MRVDGKFLDAEGNRPEGQYVRTLAPCLSTSNLQASFFIGAFIPVKTVLWSNLSLTIIQRTRVRRADPHCKAY